MVSYAAIGIATAVGMLVTGGVWLGCSLIENIQATKQRAKAHQDQAAENAE